MQTVRQVLSCRSVQLFDVNRLLSGPSHRGLHLGWIVDVYADAADSEARSALLAMILDSFRAKGVARAQAFAMGQGLARDLRRAGFVRGKSPMQFCVRARSGVSEAARDLGRWHVVFGDSDMDR